MVELRSNTQQIRNSVVFIRLIIKAFSFFNIKGKKGKRKLGKIKIHLTSFLLVQVCKLGC